MARATSSTVKENITVSLPKSTQERGRPTLALKKPAVPTQKTDIWSNKARTKGKLEIGQFSKYYSKGPKSKRFKNRPKNSSAWRAVEHKNDPYVIKLSWIDTQVFFQPISSRSTSFFFNGSRRYWRNSKG